MIPGTLKVNLNSILFRNKVNWYLSGLFFVHSPNFWGGGGVDLKFFRFLCTVFVSLIHLTRNL